MVAERDNPSDIHKSVLLKFPEQGVDSDNPWDDDLLGRKDLATKLTNLIASQQHPLTISLHGPWGTGKTFMLRRWQQALENDGYQAIYFNAWEDDFCNDPLLAIIGQLSDYFNKRGLKEIAVKVAHLALPLLKEGLFGLVKTTTGMHLPTGTDGQSKKTLVESYLEERATKDALKKSLAELSSKVAQDTKHPLVFIIDELDRCRPTFAIELLERVKHIFDVSNMVFVFGINRDEFCKSLKSIYGDIEADVYLRRFFDLELNLPKGNSEAFTRNTMGKYALGSLKNPEHPSGLDREVDVIIQDMPTLWRHLGLSLRHIDYCVRLVTLVVAGLRRDQPMFPYLLGLLVALRVENPVLYDEFVTGKRRGSEVMDYIDGIIPVRDQHAHLQEVLLRTEAHMYLTDKRFGMSRHGFPQAVEQLKLLQDGAEPTQPALLSSKTGKAAGGCPNRLLHLIDRFEGPSIISPSPSFPPTAIRYVSSLIDLNEDLVRR